ncbi:MAG: hypothetical protein PW735_00270, partial [Acidobacteriaceae bacterium]|nr:hypothetical protein [Acidobacteriaceae bacterium]
MFRFDRRLSMLLSTAAVMLLSTGPAAAAQRHSGLSSPPTAPPAGFAHDAHTAGAQGSAVSYAAVSTGLGPIEFLPISTPVAAPQSLVRQLTADDDHTRQTALAMLGAPAGYLSRPHAPTPHSVQMELAPLGE